jgi:hypothetical protein
MRRPCLDTGASVKQLLRWLSVSGHQGGYWGPYQIEEHIGGGEIVRFRIEAVETLHTPFSMPVNEGEEYDD